MLEIELEEQGEFSLFFGCHHCHYCADTEEYTRLSGDVQAILENRLCAATICYGDKQWLGSRLVWHYITVRRVKERKIYRYINGEKIHHIISPKLGERCRTDKSIYYTLDFHVTSHLLRHTYITNLIHEGVDPKTVQYLAGHEN